MHAAVQTAHPPLPPERHRSPFALFTSSLYSHLPLSRLFPEMPEPPSASRPPFLLSAQAVSCHSHPHRGEYLSLSARTINILLQVGPATPPTRAF